MIRFINASAEEFYRDCKEKKIICFGCGKYLERYAKEPFYIKPDKVIDNFRTGSCVLSGETIDVVSLEEFYKTIEREQIIVITSSYYEEMLDQLNQWKGMEEILCYIPYPYFFERSVIPLWAEKEYEPIDQKSKQYQIWERHPKLFNAGSKAPDDIRRILETQGVGSLMVDVCDDELPKDHWKKLRALEEWDRISESISDGGVLFIQHPSWGGFRKRYEVLSAVKDRGTKIVLFIHDYEKLRGELYSGYMIEEESFIFDLADILIVHNDRMKDVFVANGYDENKLICLQIFDYLCDGDVTTDRKPSKDVIVAGNLSTVKNPHISMLQSIRDVTFLLYGDGINDGVLHSNMIYRGKEDPDRLPEILPDGFGLIWGGDSTETCSGKSGDYLRFNNPHKLSLYIAANLPVIVWDESAISDFVKRHDIGFTVSSLYELPDRLQSVDERRYTQYLENVKKISRRLRKGYYTISAVKNALVKLNMEEEAREYGI